MTGRELNGEEEGFLDQERYMEWYRELFHERTRHARAGDYTTAVVFERNLDYLQKKISVGQGPAWKKFLNSLVEESTSQSYQKTTRLTHLFFTPK